MNAFASLLPAHAAISAIGDFQSLISNLKSAIPAPAPPIPGLAKYIILAVDDRELPIVFPHALQHSSMLPPGARAVSAGFYQFISADRILVGGRSETLNLGARIQDANLIKTHLLSVP